MSGMFSGKTALVTGGGSGIGEAVALGLAAEGANVVIADFNAASAQAVAAKIGAAGGNAAVAITDVSKPEDLDAAVNFAVTTYGGLHLAFNNAGIAGPTDLLADVPIDDYRRVIDVNLNSVFYGMRAEIPAMIAAGGGAIVNTSSVLGLVGEGNAVAYTTAKHGVTGMTKAAALGYATKGVRINSVHPGYIETPLIAGADDDRLISLHPMGRLGTTDEIVGVVLFMLSDKASFVTGSQYTVDGGYTAR